MYQLWDDTYTDTETPGSSADQQTGETQENSGKRKETRVTFNMKRERVVLKKIIKISRFHFLGEVEGTKLKTIHILNI